MSGAPISPYFPDVGRVQHPDHDDEPDINGFKEQQEREEAAYKTYREAMYAFVVAPDD